MSRLANRYRQAKVVREAYVAWENGSDKSDIFGLAKQLPITRKPKPNSTPQSDQSKLSYAIVSLKKWFEENPVGKSQQKSELMQPIYKLVCNNEFAEFCKPVTTGGMSEQAQKDLADAMAELRAALNK